MVGLGSRRPQKLNTTRRSHRRLHSRPFAVLGSMMEKALSACLGCRGCLSVVCQYAEMFSSDVSAPLTIGPGDGDGQNDLRIFTNDGAGD